MAMRSSRRIGIGLFLAGIALLVGCKCWLASRTLVALDVPVSLSRGHITTHEFDVNLDSGYFIEIEVEKSPALNNLECQMWGCYETPAVLKVQWAISSAGRTELSGASDNTNGASGRWETVGRQVGYFRSSGGRFRLEVDVLADASNLNAGNPRLKVEADGGGYEHLDRLSSELPPVPGIFVIIGGTLLLLSLSARTAERSTAIQISAAPGVRRLTTRALRRLPREPVVSGFPPFALVAAFLPLLLLIPLLVSPRP